MSPSCSRSVSLTPRGETISSSVRGIRCFLSACWLGDRRAEEPERNHHDDWPFSERDLRPPADGEGHLEPGLRFGRRWRSVGLSAAGARGQGYVLETLALEGDPVPVRTAGEVFVESDFAQPER